jgi:membrane fusion protein (multidrug efflux system)
VRAAAVEQSKAQLTEEQLNLSYTTIRSPATGIASYAQIADGTYLSPANSQLTTVSVLSPMWINFSIPRTSSSALLENSSSAIK